MDVDYSKGLGLCCTVSHWCLSKIRMVKISSAMPIAGEEKERKPIQISEGSTLEVGEYNISGTHRLRMDGVFILCHRRNDEYWPHDYINFNDTAGTWKAFFKVWDKAKFPPNEWDLVVMEINPAGRVVVDYFRETSVKNGGVSIKLPTIPKGWKIFHHVTIKREG